MAPPTKIQVTPDDVDAAARSFHTAAGGLKDTGVKFGAVTLCDTGCSDLDNEIAMVVGDCGQSASQFGDQCGARSSTLSFAAFLYRWMDHLP